MSSDSPAFVNTNVLVYAFDEGDPARQETAGRLLSELMDSNQLRLSTQVFQELFVTMTRKARQPWSVDEAVEILDDLANWPVISPDYPTIRDAALLSCDATISFWDSLVVIAAARSGAEILYTKDLNHGQMIGGVRVIDPFR